MRSFNDAATDGPDRPGHDGKGARALTNVMAGPVPAIRSGTVAGTLSNQAVALILPFRILCLDQVQFRRERRISA